MLFPADGDGDSQKEWKKRGGACLTAGWVRVQGD